MKNFQMRKFSVRFLACKLVMLSFLNKIKKKLSSSNIRDVHRCTEKHLEFSRLKAANLKVFYLLCEISSMNSYDWAC